MKKQGTGSAGRYGTRYGRSNREKVGQLEEMYKTKQECSYCHAKSVRRVSAGIFHCKHCGSVFTAKAYAAK